MPYLHTFGANDILKNRMVAHPQYEFVMYNGYAYLNNDRDLGVNLPTGTVNLFEMNVDREPADTNLIYPWIIKDNHTNTLGTLTGSAWASVEFGSKIQGEYPLTASIARQYFSQSAYIPSPDGSDAINTDIHVRNEFDQYVTDRREIIALKNTMNYNRYLSNSYEYTGTYVSGGVNLLQVPSIMFGDGIEKGTVKLRYYYTGSLIGEASDLHKNGELVSTLGGASGSVVGVVLYNEGFIMLTSSIDISTDTDNYEGDGLDRRASWLHYGAYLPTGETYTHATASLYTLEFKGTQKIPSMTMFATARQGDVNNSMNPTWVSSSNANWKDKTATGPAGYIEPLDTAIKNTIQSDYCNFEDDFEKQVFISEIAIFDEDKNLLGIAKLANPVLKKESDQYTFKLNLDM